MTVRPALRAVLVSLLGVITLASIGAVARGYLFCHMAQRAMPVCCCQTAHATDDAPAPPMIERACCEFRGDATVGQGVAKTDPTPVSIAGDGVALAAVVSVPSVVTAWRPAVRHHRGAHISARASPLRPGKHRARLGVMIC